MASTTSTPGSRTLGEAVRVVEGWQRLIEQVAFGHIETHRDRMTNDLHFTLRPDRRRSRTETPGRPVALCGPRNRFAVSAESSADRHILEHCWAHGRRQQRTGAVAARLRPTPAVDRPAHRLVAQGFTDWRQRAAPDAERVLSPNSAQPYAISGTRRSDLADRWACNCAVSPGAWEGLTPVAMPIAPLAGRKQNSGLA
jgi:hypothetical protein